MKNKKGLLKRLAFKVGKVLLVLFAITLLQILFFNWINPFTSSVMLQRQINSFFSDKKSVKYKWCDYKAISEEMTLAVVASEDQSFPTHFGFDIEQINKAIKESKKRRRLRGASTITQQVAKNLFLWEGKSFIRKGFEAYYTVLLELIWSKKRIIEVYLNIAEMGDNVFGVGIASKIYFKKLPLNLKIEECALLAAILPNPVRFSAINPSEYTLKRREWVIEQMSHLGGVDYIKNLN